MIFRNLNRMEGFTLVEMLTVIVLIGVLMAAAGLSVRKANELSKNTKAEAECRELVNALLEYRETFQEWPNDITGGREYTTASFLEPLTNPKKNKRGLVFLNLSLPEGEDWYDPWGRQYQVFFPDSEGKKYLKAIEECISFPFRRSPPVE